MLSRSIWPINRILIGATPPGQSGPGSDGNEGLRHIPRSDKTEALPSDCLVSYLSLAGSYLFTKIYSQCILQP